jgi:hypothetical protein
MPAVIIAAHSVSDALIQGNAFKRATWGLFVASIQQKIVQKYPLSATTARVYRSGRIDTTPDEQLY